MEEYRSETNVVGVGLCLLRDGDYSLLDRSLRWLRQRVLLARGNKTPTVFSLV